jgi:hypothetical protein
MREPSIPALRADYDKKWEVYADAYDKAVEEANAKVAHLKQDMRDAYRKLAKACREAGVYG